MVMVSTVTTRKRGQPLFEVIIFPLTIRQAEPPAIIVHHDVNMVGVVEEKLLCGCIVASSKFHFGEADSQMNLLNIVGGISHSKPCQLQWRNSTDTKMPMQPGAATVSGFYMRPADQIAADGNDCLAAFQP